MSIIVSKFGGSSIADANGFRRVREIAASQKRRHYIVLSAPGKRTPGDDKITDLLVEANRLCARNCDCTSVLFAVKARFTSIIQRLQLDIDPEQFLHDLANDVHISADHAASRGEYLCAKLFSAYTGFPFVDAAKLIHFDKNGRIQRDEIAHAVCAMASEVPYAVIPGFYVSKPDGRIKTFTRGGADITGALVSAALNADVYENWTDVDGLMSIDPRICTAATCHPAVSYRQMRMLAKAGAQVLHPYCVEPVCEAGIPTVLKNTFSPEKPGTYISDHVRRSVPCICAQSGYAVVSIRTLNEESRKIASGLNADLYHDSTGGKFITLKSDDNSIGTPISIVSAFGLPAKLREEATMRVHALAELHDEHCSKYLVETERSADVQRTLHALTMGITESRIPSDCVESCHSSL